MVRSECAERDGEAGIAASVSCAGGARRWVGSVRLGVLREKEETGRLESPLAAP
ncbi:MAG: hypothetical protein INR71_03585 [Terriglobus roseus]|nr:hypothetical protein [Terriglobus roseus]